MFFFRRKPKTPKTKNGIKVVPESCRAELSMALFKADLDTVRRIMKRNSIDADSFLDPESYRPLIMETLSSYGYQGDKSLRTMRYLLDNGADPNTRCKSGYNCFHMALQDTTLTLPLKLLLQYKPDVNISDEAGANLAYWAIQSFAWNFEGTQRQMRLEIIEKVLMLGADLDQPNFRGMTPRKWLEHKPDEVKQLVEKCEALHPSYTPVRVLQPEFPSNLTYPDIAKKIWKELVPPSGQADTVQGELLRAIEKLRDEAQRNGNINYGKDHKMLAQFVMNKLTESGIFNNDEIKMIKTETRKLMKASSPYTDDDAYDYLTDQVCRFYLKFDQPIKHEQNPEILH